MWEKHFSIFGRLTFLLIELEKVANGGLNCFLDTKQLTLGFDILVKSNRTSPFCPKGDKQKSFLRFWEITRVDVYRTSRKHFPAAPLLEKYMTWHLVICVWPLTLKITSSKMQITLLQSASFLALKCFRARSSSNICHWMGAFAHSSTNMHIFSAYVAPTGIQPLRRLC